MARSYKRCFRYVPGNMAESTLGAAVILIVFILGVALEALVFVYGQTITQVRDAAQQGVRVAAYTSNQSQVLSAISTTLTTASLPTTWNGNQTYNASTTVVQSGAGIPITTLTMHYNLPNLFPNLPGAFGLGQGVNVPITVITSAVDNEYFTQGGSP